MTNLEEVSAAFTVADGHECVTERAKLGQFEVLALRGLCKRLEERARLGRVLHLNSVDTHTLQAGKKI